jgi:hypothetical protein
MLEWLDAPDNVLAAALRGQVAPTDADELYQSLENRFEAGFEHVAIMLDISEAIGFGAAWFDVERAWLPRLAGQRRDISRYALVTDDPVWRRQALRGAAGMGEVRVFHARQRQEALAWAAGQGERMAGGL